MPPTELLKELVRVLDLPETFIVEQKAEEPTSAPGQVSQPDLPPELNEIVRNPSVANVSSVLPNMEA